jgi:hypothetical protein
MTVMTMRAIPAMAAKANNRNDFRSTVLYCHRVQSPRSSTTVGWSAAADPGGLKPIGCYDAVMKLRALLSLAAGVALSFGAAVTGLGQQPTAELKVGDTAPPFSLQGSDGKSYRLADFKGKSAVVLAWFPKAFTGG